MLLVMSLYFFHLVLKQVNAVVVVIIPLIHMRNCVFIKNINVKVSKLLIYSQEPMKQNTNNGMKLVNANVD